MFTNHVSKRKIRHDFFKNINTEIQAYLLGFYAADGNINEKRKTLRIHLQIQDADIVNLYRDIISPDARTFIIPEHITTGRNKKLIRANTSYGIDICSSKICNNLINLGFGYNKSYNENHIPKILETFYIFNNFLHNSILLSSVRLFSNTTCPRFCRPQSRSFSCSLLFISRAVPSPPSKIFTFSPNTCWICFLANG